MFLELIFIIYTSFPSLMANLSQLIRTYTKLDFEELDESKSLDFLSKLKNSYVYISSYASLKYDRIVTNQHTIDLHLDGDTHKLGRPINLELYSFQNRRFDFVRLQ